MAEFKGATSRRRERGRKRERQGKDKEGIRKERAGGDNPRNEFL